MTLTMDKPKTATATDVLNRAADLLDEHGWVKGWLGTENVGFCATGAIRHAAVEMRVPEVAIRRAYLPHCATDDGGWNDLIVFNDEHGRTKEDVQARLRELAELCA